MSDATTRITRDEAGAIHDMSLARFGGLPGVRDEGLLDSALAQPFQIFGGEELYPTDAEKAARLAWGLAKNHPFLDGNKRVATACMGAFLRVNGHEFRPKAHELLATMLGVAAGTMSYGDFASWVAEQGG